MLLFADLADGGGQLYFDDLASPPGVLVGVANAGVACSANANGANLASAAASIVISGAATEYEPIQVGVANAQVTISAANDPNQTFLLIGPAIATVEIFGYVGTTRIGASNSSVLIGASASGITPTASCTASVVAGANAAGIKVGTASASVVVSGVAAGASENISTSPANAQVVIFATAGPRQLGNAFGSVSLTAQASGINLVLGSATATVAIGARAVEAAGVVNFPQAAAEVTVGARAVASVIAAPVLNPNRVTGKSIDWKTICDAANANAPPVPEYEFGYGKARRVFRQTGS